MTFYNGGSTLLLAYILSWLNSQINTSLSLHPAGPIQKHQMRMNNQSTPGAAATSQKPPSDSRYKALHWRLQQEAVSFKWHSQDKETCSTSPSLVLSPNLWSRRPLCLVPCKWAWWQLFVQTLSSLSQGTPTSQICPKQPPRNSAPHHQSGPEEGEQVSGGEGGSSYLGNSRERDRMAFRLGQV